MNTEQIKQKKREVIERIHLGDQVYTFDEPNVPQMDSRLRRYTQIAADITGKPLETLRVLDLARLEGHYGIELALHGADVVAIEGREANFAKAALAKEILSIGNFNLILGDVRNLDRDIHGGFDVVLCLGILYHLDTPVVMNFVDSMFKVCDGITIIDTHFVTNISQSDAASYTWRGKTYSGVYAKEHNSDATP
jgi:2-polyprenyl-3-methyl-5-hydroxy-6-metoxy-1,4-benzoquinol methylase